MSEEWLNQFLQRQLLLEILYEDNPLIQPTPRATVQEKDPEVVETMPWDEGAENGVEG